MDDIQRLRAASFEASEDVGRSPENGLTLDDVLELRFGRRTLLQGLLGSAAVAATAPLGAYLSPAQAAGESRFPFTELAAGVDEDHHVAEGYQTQVVMRWGDPVLANAPAFDPKQQTPQAQRAQFGYNNDFLAYYPMPGAANPSQHGLLVVNHEYTNEELMFPGLGRQSSKDVNFAGMNRALVDIEMAAHGGSVLEIRRSGDKWDVVANSRYARRIDAQTPMEVTGPAAGHARLRTSVDPSGRRVLGMLNNCAGGQTPWGTWLTCEENFNGYFNGKLPEDHLEVRNYRRYGVPTLRYAWGQFHDRFNLGKEPNEPNRFGWVVEIDPFDPTSVPKKRTALGRFKHEGSAGIVNRDGRYVVYSGDDERFDYVYRFVTEGRVDPANPAANRELLDRGTLSVARYNADGSVDWPPLVFGEGPLTAANGFESQADVLIETRRAADFLGATRMDRPEDVEANPKTNAVYVLLTGSNRSEANPPNKANPRMVNPFGHIIEMMPPEGDHTAAKYRWDILVLCGDPAKAEVGATWNPATSKSGWFVNPDNCVVDDEGRLWIATDGNSAPKSGRADGLWALETEGAQRGAGKLFYRVPVGAELCGPVFTPDRETLFVAIQHPGETVDGDKIGATFENPSTRWPDFKPDMPPRPSIVAITKKGGGKIAG